MGDVRVGSKADIPKGFQRAFADGGFSLAAFVSADDQNAPQAAAEARTGTSAKRRNRT